MRIVVYGYDYCPYTRNAAALAGVPIIEARVLLQCAPDNAVLVPLRNEVRAAQHQTIPMCFDMDKRGAKFIGGHDQLVLYMENNKSKPTTKAKKVTPTKSKSKPTTKAKKATPTKSKSKETTKAQKSKRRQVI